MAVECSSLPVLDRTSEPIKVFVSYSRRDQDLCGELIKRLKILKDQGWIDTWHDGQIDAGLEWQKEIEAQLKSAQIILLLISDDFLASDNCYHNELMQALKRHEQNEAIVIPIILRPSDWLESRIGKLQALPDNALPVTLWGNRDEAFLRVVQGIRRTVKQLRHEQQQKLERIEQERNQQEQQRQEQKLEQIREALKEQQEKEIQQRQREQQLEQEAQRRAEREQLERREKEKQEIQRLAEQAQAQLEWLAQRREEQTRLQQAPRTQKFQRLPWVSLSSALLAYTFSGFILATYSAPLLAWVCAWAWTGVGTWVLSWVEDGTEFKTLPQALPWALTLVWALILNWALDGILDRSVAGAFNRVVVGRGFGLAAILAGAWAWATDKLLESFSKFHVFCILTAISTIGLTLGALIYWSTHPPAHSSLIL